jgi:hypothetical protein
MSDIGEQDITDTWLPPDAPIRYTYPFDRFTLPHSLPKPTDTYNPNSSYDHLLKSSGYLHELAANHSDRFSARQNKPSSRPPSRQTKARVALLTSASNMSDSDDDKRSTKTPVLNEMASNYPDWKEGVTDALAAKRLLRLCVRAEGKADAKKPRPAESGDEQDAWDDKAMQAMAIIRRTLGTHRAMIRGLETPYKALETLHNHFSQTTKYDIATLQSRWINSKPTGNHFPEYITQMIELKRAMKDCGCVPSIGPTENQMVVLMHARLREYPTNHPYHRAFNQIDFKYDDNPGAVDLDYFRRFVMKAQHEVNNSNIVEEEEEKAFMTQAQERGLNYASKKKTPGQSHGTVTNSFTTTLSKNLSSLSIDRTRDQLYCRFERIPGHRTEDCKHPKFNIKVWEANKAKRREREKAMIAEPDLGKGDNDGHDRYGGRAGDRSGSRSPTYQQSAHVASVSDDVMTSELDLYISSPRTGEGELDSNHHAALIIIGIRGTHAVHTRDVGFHLVRRSVRRLSRRPSRRPITRCVRRCLTSTL